MKDGIDYVPMSKNRNSLIHLLNIAGMGPIIGAVQGILFGPIAFFLIPLGCIFAGGVHDYFAGMLSVRNNGAQITGLIDKYLGKTNIGLFLTPLIAPIPGIMCRGVHDFGRGYIFISQGFRKWTANLRLINAFDRLCAHDVERLIIQNRSLEKHKTLKKM